jgi:uncharacterized spore protein YtfJ
MERQPGKESVMAVEAQERSQLATELLERIGQTVGQRAQVSTIFGEPVERERVTVIPVAKARFGFGGGGGGGSGTEGDEGSGGGGGGGVSVSPIGYIEVRDDSAEFKRISTPTDLLGLVAAASLAALAVKRLLD